MSRHSSTFVVRVTYSTPVAPPMSHGQAEDLIAKRIGDLRSALWPTLGIETVATIQIGHEQHGA